MTNQVTPFQAGALPASIMQNGSALSDAALGGVSGGSPDRISLRNSRFHFYIDGSLAKTLEQTQLQVVLIGASPHVQRTYYDTTFDPNASTAPACSSADGVTPNGGDKRQGTACSTCPQNVKQPNPREPGKMHTPCSFSKDIVVWVVGDAEYRPYLLSLSAMTLFSKEDNAAQNLYSFRGVQQMLKGHSVPVEAAVLTLSFDLQQSVPKLLFTPTGVCGAPGINYSEADYQHLFSDAVQSKVNDLLTINESAPATTATPIAQVPAAPVPEAQVAAPQAPAPQAQAEQVQEAPAPQAPAPQAPAPQPQVAPTPEPLAQVAPAPAPAPQATAPQPQAQAATGEQELDALLGELEQVTKAELAE